jgi:hypothetical protein
VTACQNAGSRIPPPHRRPSFAADSAQDALVIFVIGVALPG